MSVILAPLANSGSWRFPPRACRGALLGTHSVTTALTPLKTCFKYVFKEINHG